MGTHGLFTKKKKANNDKVKLNGNSLAETPKRSVYILIMFFNPTWHKRKF